MEGKLIASYRRELSALDDLQCAGTVTYTLTQEADAFVITVQRDGARTAACMLCEIEEERAGMLTRFLYETPWSLRIPPRYCMTSVDRRWADMAVLLHDRPEAAGQKQREALRLPRTSAVVALFAFSSRMDRDSMRLFARTWGRGLRRGHCIDGSGGTGAAARRPSPAGACARRPADQAVRDAGLAGDQHDAAGPGAGSPCAGARAGGNRRAQGAGPVCPVPDHAAPLRMKNLFDEIYRMAQQTTSIGSITCAAAVRMCWMTSARGPH